MNFIFYLSLESFPGLWEVPIVDYFNEKGISYHLIDSCPPYDQSNTPFRDLLDSNFQLHYTTNRAPVFMPLSAEWLGDDDRLEG